MRVDLHSHSTASDGQLAPAELVRRAVAQRVDVLALTDHDVVSGLNEAQATIVAEQLPLRLIPGIELSTSWDALEIHVVGLNIQPEAAPLQAAIESQAQARQARGVEIGRRLAKQRIEQAYEGTFGAGGGGESGREPILPVTWCRPAIARTSRRRLITIWGGEGLCASRLDEHSRRH